MLDRIADRQLGFPDLQIILCHRFSLEADRGDFVRPQCQGEAAVHGLERRPPPLDAIGPSGDKPPVWMSTKLCEWYDADTAQAVLQGTKVKYNSVIDPETGEFRDAQLFLAALGASSYFYIEAQWSQELPHWIEGHVRAFGHFYMHTDEHALHVGDREAHAFAQDGGAGIEGAMHHLRGFDDTIFVVLRRGQHDLYPVILAEMIESPGN